MTSRWSINTKRAVMVGGLVLGMVLLVRAQEVVTPFIWAGVFAYVFAPVVGWLQRRTRSPRVVIVAGLFGVLALALYSLGRLLLPLAVEQAGELQRDLPTLVNNIEVMVLSALEGSGYEVFAVSLFDQADQLVQLAATNLIPAAIGAAATLLKVLVFLISLWYLLLDGPRLGAALRQVLPASQRDELLRLLGRIHLVLGQYVRGQVVLIAIMWTATAIGLSVLGVPFSILLGFITGVLETIPIVGPITAGAIAVVVALGHPNTLGLSQLAYAALVAVMYTVLRYVEDYFVIPQVIGRIVELHPLLVIFALFVGGAVGGLLGILLAVPIAASLRVAVLYALAKLRDEDPFPAVAETVEGGAAVAGATRRSA